MEPVYHVTNSRFFFLPAISQCERGVRGCVIEFGVYGHLENMNTINLFNNRNRIRLIWKMTTIQKVGEHWHALLSLEILEKKISKRLFNQSRANAFHALKKKSFLINST